MTDKPQTLAEQIRVEEIECVSIESGFEEPADPIWRIALNGYCADFEYREAAENFAEQIRAALADAAYALHQCCVAQSAELATLRAERDAALDQRDMWMNRAMNELGDNLALKGGA